MKHHIIEVVVAHSLWARARGLIHRPRLPHSTALHLKPCWCVHTAWMQRCIDVVFLDGRHAVLRVVESLHPWRMAGHRSARSVLELNAGEARRLQLRPGDTLVLTELHHAASLR